MVIVRETKPGRSTSPSSKLTHYRWAGSLDERFATLSGDALDAEAMLLADELSSRREYAPLRRRIHDRADIESAAALLVGLRARDPEVLLLDPETLRRMQGAPTVLLQALRRTFSTPVDDHRTDTLGDLLSLAMPVPNVPEPALFVSIFLAGWMVNLRDAAGLMENMTEERAVPIRAFMRAGARSRPELDVTYRPDLVGCTLLTFDRIAQQIPAILDPTSWPSTPQAA
jgi:hypothetical protein